METKANYIVTGAFTLAVIFGVFGFIYWVQNTGGGGERDTYRVVFVGSVSGLRAGSTVLFNGMRAGEVTTLSLDAADPRKVDAVISLDRGIPVRADSKVKLEFQGLTGIAQIALSGGAPDAPRLASAAGVPTIYADPNASADLTQAARDVLSRIDGLVSENETALHATLHNIESVTATLARNTERLDHVLAGVENLTGAGGDNRGEIGEAAASIRRLADNLDKRTEEISAGLSQFSNSGLKEFAAFAVDGRRTLAELNKAIKNIDQHPTRLIFGH